MTNHILLIFKYYAYKTRENGSLKKNIHKRNDIGKQITLSKPKKPKKIELKWKLLLKNTGHFFKYVVVRQLGGGTGNDYIYIYIYIYI